MRVRFKTHFAVSTYVSEKLTSTDHPSARPVAREQREAKNDWGFFALR